MFWGVGWEGTKTHSHRTSLYVPYCPLLFTYDTLLYHFSSSAAFRAQEAGAIAVVVVNHSDVLFNVLGQMPELKLPGAQIRR